MAGFVPDQMKVSGFNHVTIRVSDLARSLAFYVDVLGMQLVHRGRKDVYLEWGRAWVCLIETEEKHRKPKESLGVDHIAFSIDEADFEDAVHLLQQAEVPIVRGPLRRGQGWAVNFLDPDGTQLELHTSDLEQRMAVWS